MDGRRKTKDRVVKSHSKVSQVWSFQASRPGLDQGLYHHHRPQVEGVEGLMGDVPQVVACKGGMLAPRTRLQHLVDSEVLLKKKKRSNATSLPSSRGRNRLFRTQELVGTRYCLPEPEGDSVLQYLLLATPCGDKQLRSSAVKVMPDRPHRT